MTILIKYDCDFVCVTYTPENTVGRYCRVSVVILPHDFLSLLPVCCRRSWCGVINKR